MWVIETFTMFDGWANTWQEGIDEPAVFATEGQARLALQEFLEEAKDDFGEDEYVLEDYRIREISDDEEEYSELDFN